MSKRKDVLPVTGKISPVMGSFFALENRNFIYLRFYSFNDLQEQMKRYLYRSNNIPMAVLAWKSPNQKQRELGGR